MRRFTRLTNAFSKKVDNHKAAVVLHFMHYNFARIHKTLRVTPAMLIRMVRFWRSAWRGHGAASRAWAWREYAMPSNGAPNGCPGQTETLPGRSAGCNRALTIVTTM